MHIIIFEGNTPELLEDNWRSNIDLSAARYGEALQACDPSVTFEVAEPYREDYALGDQDFEKFDGAVFTGSGVSWSTQDAKALPQQKTMEAVFNTGLPTLGSCNGMQLAATVLGGSVDASPNGMELGLALDIRLTEFGKTHAYHRGRNSVFSCPCIHRDEVNRLPDGAKLTATNQHSQVQAMVYEKEGVQFWGTQYHPEYTLKQMVAVLQKPGVMFQAMPDHVNALIAIEAGDGVSADIALRAAPSDLVEKNRLVELRNWLAHVGKAKLAA